MKYWLLAVLSVAFGALVLANPLAREERSLLGAKECTWGPTHWCKNFTNAKICHATKHCIQTVWEKQSVPEDNDSVCQICLDMVKQARDQLESNMTQDDLRAVFEGSCKLIYVKPIVKECIRMVDDFIPELIEALASQMNPQVVCSVAGLCNNAHIDQMLEEAATPGKPSSTEEVSASGEGFTCGKCSSIASQITTKFHSTKRDTVLENMLEMCGQFGSFSDACSSIVLTHFNELYEHLSQHMTPDGICHLSGTCSGKFHQHDDDQSAEIVVRPMSDVGYVRVKDDIPCELCEQLVNHLRDLLVANTTELEFEDVMKGLCKQTHSFADECLSIVNQYYPQIYEFLTKNLNSNEACFYIGVCPKGDAVQNAPIAPLVPFDVSLPTFYKAGDNQPKKMLGEDEPTLSSDEIQQFQLPLERLMIRKPIKALQDQEQVQAQQLPIDQLMGAPNGLDLVEGGSWCTMCEYAMHFVQEEISDPKNEEQIKIAVLNTCSRMPNTIRSECNNFVQLYGDALIALLVQEVDPATVCPQLKLCPPNKQDVEVFAPSSIEVQVHSESSNKASCPLCLLAVEQAKNLIKDDHSIDKVKHVLENLCSHLKNKKLRLECDDFVETYSKELINLLINDFTPQEICVQLSLCTDQKTNLNTLGIRVLDSKDHEIETNEINDFTIDGIMISNVNREVVPDTPECMLCKDIVKEVEKRVVNKKSMAEIKAALEHACDKVPKKARDVCHTYVEEHGDQIANLIVENLSPKEVCAQLQLCGARRMDSNVDDDDLVVDDAMQVTVFASPKRSNGFNRLYEPSAQGSGQVCVFCEILVQEMEKNLKQNSTHDEIRNFLDQVCDLCPKPHRGACVQFVEKNSEELITVFSKVPPHEVCTELKFCDKVSEDEKLQRIDIEEPEVTSGQSCVFCELVVSQMDKDLKKNATHEEVRRYLDTVCDLCPQKHRSSCVKFIEQYGEALIVTFEHIPPHMICKQLQLCSQVQDPVQMISKNEIVECAVCQGTVTALESLIKNKQVDDDVEGLLRDACQSVPARYNERCLNMVNVYGISMIEQIKEYPETHNICVDIGMCYQNQMAGFSRKETVGTMYAETSHASAEVKESKVVTEKPHLVGENECTWGPSHFCKDLETATKCRAVHYCKTKSMGMWNA